MLARAGQIIRDKDGNAFATVTRDLFRGDIARRSDLIFADGHVPVYGEPIPSPVLDALYGVTA